MDMAQFIPLCKYVITFSDFSCNNFCNYAQHSNHFFQSNETQGVTFFLLQLTFGENPSLQRVGGSVEPSAGTITKVCMIAALDTIHIVTNFDIIKLSR